MESLKRYITRERLTQCGLAQVFGISQAHMCRLLSGERNPSVQLLHKMAAVTGIRIEKLLKELKPDGRAS